MSIKNDIAKPAQIVIGLTLFFFAIVFPELGIPLGILDVIFAGTAHPAAPTLSVAQIEVGIGGLFLVLLATYKGRR